MVEKLPDDLGQSIINPINEGQFDSLFQSLCIISTS